MSVMEKNSCPYCGSEDTEGAYLKVPKDIHKRLMAWTEYKCKKCGTEYIDGKLVIVLGTREE